MARIIDKDTRLIDVDFGQLSTSAGRGAGSNVPDTLALGGGGQGQLLQHVIDGKFNGGSFIQYVRLDLSYMTKNNEVMMPVEASIQRTSPVPLGNNNNGNTFDQIEEYIYILSRPLNNTELAAVNDFTYYEDLRQLGLNGSEGTGLGTTTNVSGVAGWPSQEQTIYAEKRMYSYSTSLGATQNNGGLRTAADVPPNLDYISMMGMPVLDNVSTWGSMGAIVGPNLHCYRVVINRNQSFPGLPDVFANVDLDGNSVCYWPAVSVRFLCKDPNFSEGEYLTRIANAMNNIAEGGPTA